MTGAFGTTTILVMHASEKCETELDVRKEAIYREFGCGIKSKRRILNIRPKEVQ